MATDRREGVEREGGRGGGLIFVLIEHFYHSVSVFACKCPLTSCLLSCFVCCRFKCVAFCVCITCSVLLLNLS